MKVNIFSSPRQNITTCNSMVVYEYSCPMCSEQYIGKTESRIFNRIKRHGWRQKDGAIYTNILVNVRDGHTLRASFNVNSEESGSNKELQINTVRENTRILSRADDWRTQAYKGSLKIRQAFIETSNSR